jgi:hypothetical protein
MNKGTPGGKDPHSPLPPDPHGRSYAEGYIDSESLIEGSSARQNLALWVAVLGSAAVWFVHMQINYVLVEWACWTNRPWVLKLTSLLFLLVAAAPGWIAWNQWSAAGSGERQSAGLGRRRFMAVLGLMLTGLFVLLIAAQAIPTFFVNPCLE